VIVRPATPMFLEQGRVRLTQLTELVRQEFPRIQFTRATLNDSGEDHVVVVLDDEWVFRFPRVPEYAVRAAGERRLLEILATVVSLAIPVYEYVSAAGDFGGYRIIRGEPLSELRFAGLERAAQERVMGEIADFLVALHALPTSILETADVAHSSGHLSGSDFARRFHDRRSAFAAKLSPTLFNRIDKFYHSLPKAVDSASNVLIHGDFTEDHYLLAPTGDRLAGVIDFSDAGRGDPAFDFASLWAFGDWPVRYAVRRYSAATDSGGMIERSLWWFGRYRIDQIWWGLSGAREYDVAKISSELPAVFDLLGV
jgi:aminoglycoside 2''-phosphotransferase